MSVTAYARRTWSEFISALQFLTRIPVPSQPYAVDSLARSVKFFPLVGVVVGGGAALLHLLIAPHLPRAIAALLVLLYLVLVTGCLTEDGLADAADGFGGGRPRADSASSCATAASAVMGRCANLSSALPSAAYLVASHHSGSSLSDRGPCVVPLDNSCRQLLFAGCMPQGRRWIRWAGRENRKSYFGWHACRRDALQLCRRSDPAKKPCNRSNRVRRRADAIDWSLLQATHRRYHRRLLRSDHSTR